MTNDNEDMTDKFNVKFIKVKNAITKMTDLSLSFIKNAKLSLLF